MPEARIDEDLPNAAARAWQLSATLCDGCRAYRGLWPWLRLAGLILTPFASLEVAHTAFADAGLRVESLEPLEAGSGGRGGHLALLRAA